MVIKYLSALEDINFLLLGKLPKKNLPGKTFHGTFYNTRKAAQDKYLTRRGAPYKTKAT